jgi:hypothetical protein
MKPVRITPQADRDIDTCFALIAKDKPAAARQNSSRPEDSLIHIHCRAAIHRAAPSSFGKTTGKRHDSFLLAARNKRHNGGPGDFCNSY